MGRISYLYSLDDGRTWQEARQMAVKPNANRNKGTPVDEIHHQVVDIPKGNKSVLVKYSMFKFGLWNLRAEADYLPADANAKPLDVTFTWNEMQKDYSKVKRSHTQLVDKLPAKYEINVGGFDHPEMLSLAVNQKGSAAAATTQPVKYGYSDGKDNADVKKYVGTWVTYGKDVALGKKYTFDQKNFDMGDTVDKDFTRLTDGYVGPFQNSGACWTHAAGWTAPAPEVNIDLDLEKETNCAAIGMKICGDDALAGKMKNNFAVEVFVSPDNKDFKSIGFINADARYKDLPYNFMLEDDEIMSGGNFYVPMDKPVKARYVKYRIKVIGGIFFTTELFVHDSVTVKPFDIGIALPDEKPAQPALQQRSSQQ
jgi:hypothetical protein